MIPDEVYVLVGEYGVPIIAHTREEGADEEMSGYPESEQKYMTVTCVRLVDDDPA